MLAALAAPTSRGRCSVDCHSTATTTTTKKTNDAASSHVCDDTNNSDRTSAARGTAGLRGEQRGVRASRATWVPPLVRRPGDCHNTTTTASPSYPHHGTSITKRTSSGRTSVARLALCQPQRRQHRQHMKRTAQVTKAVLPPAGPSRSPLVRLRLPVQACLLHVHTVLVFCQRM